MTQRWSWLPLCLLFTSPALADTTIERRTQVEFGGAIGKLAGLFGGKAMREGTVTTVVLAGDRKLDRTERHGDLIDLAAETVTTLDYGKKRATVKTFAQIRKEIQEAMARAHEASAEPREAGPADPNAPQYEFELDVKESGKTQSLAGYECREVELIATAHVKGKTLQEGGGSVITTTLCLAKEIAGEREIAAFELRYAKQLGLQDLFGGAAQQMASVIAMYPEMQELTKKIHDKQVNLSGSAVKTVMEMVSYAPAGGAEGQPTAAGPGQKDAREGGGEEAAQDGGQRSGGLSGMLGRMASKMGKKKGGGDEASGADGTAAAPGQTQVFRSVTELIKVSGQADPAALAVPAGFKS